MLLLRTAIIAYFIGNVSFAIILGKISKNIDIRQHGSGNAGATNMGRVMGFSYGVMVFLGDFLKAIAAMMVGEKTGGEYGMIIAGLSVVIGHDFPLLYRFRGGKGIATSIGVSFFLSPIYTILACLITFGLGLICGYMSVGSILFLLSLPILFYLSYGLTPLGYVSMGLALAILGLYQHRGNIQRLMSGTENRMWRSSK